RRFILAMRDGDGANKNKIAVFDFGVTPKHFPHDMLLYCLNSGSSLVARRSRSLALAAMISQFPYSSASPQAEPTTRIRVPVLSSAGEYRGCITSPTSCR